MSWPERSRLLPRLISVLPGLAMSLVTTQGGGAILVAPISKPLCAAAGFV
jgi:hypothetical protein